MADHVIHDAFAGEFSRHEIVQTIACLYRLILAFWQTMKDDPHETFLRAVTSNLVLFGFCDGRTFEKQYVSDTRFHSMREKYEQRVNEQKAANGQAVTRSATDEEVLNGFRQCWADSLPELIRGSWYDAIIPRGYTVMSVTIALHDELAERLQTQARGP